jgi:hypothetical protein
VPEPARNLSARRIAMKHSPVPDHRVASGAVVSKHVQFHWGFRGEGDDGFVQSVFNLEA